MTKDFLRRKTNDRSVQKRMQKDVFLNKVKIKIGLGIEIKEEKKKNIIMTHES